MRSLVYSPLVWIITAQLFCICRSDGYCFVFPLFLQLLFQRWQLQGTWLSVREKACEKERECSGGYWLLLKSIIFTSGSRSLLTCSFLPVICHMEEQCTLSKQFHFHRRQVITGRVHFPFHRLALAAAPSLIL